MGDWVQRKSDRKRSLSFEEFTNSGYRMVWGHLKGRGLVIQQSRVRESRCGELNALRWFRVTERRKYKVASPNAL